MAENTTAASALPATGGTSAQGLAGWAAPYITGYLGQAQALSGKPYETYQGPLTAGQSPLQGQAFQGIGGLTVPNQGQYTAVGGSFTDQGVSQNYMNPYLQNALNPTLDELRRQSQITQMGNAAKFVGAGAFGGARQGIMDSETQRNLLNQIARTTGEGYATAYDKAMAQYNAEQARKINEAQFGSEFGLRGLEAQKGIYDQMMRAGDVQRGIEQQGIAADLGEFEKQREFPYKQVQFQRDMISGLPVSSVTNTPAQLSGVAQLLASVGGIDKLLATTGQGSLADLLKNLGLNLGGTETA